MCKIRRGYAAQGQAERMQPTIPIAADCSARNVGKAMRREELLYNAHCLKQGEDGSRS